MATLTESLLTAEEFAAGVARLRDVGVPAISLSVNGRNESALGLYESEGFVRVRTRDRWARPVADADAVAETRP